MQIIKHFGCREKNHYERLCCDPVMQATDGFRSALKLDIQQLHPHDGGPGVSPELYSSGLVWDTLLEGAGTTESRACL